MRLAMLAYGRNDGSGLAYHALKESGKLLCSSCNSRACGTRSISHPASVGHVNRPLQL